jgi:hypothetical protein
MKHRLFEREMSGKPAMVFSTILMLAIGLGLARFAWNQVAEVSRRDSFSTATGLIKAQGEPVRVVARRSRSSTLDLTYSFNVNDVEYTGTQIGRSLDEPRLRQPEVNDLRAAFQNNRPVEIRYNPANPAENNLELTSLDSRSRTASRVAAAFAGLLLLLGVGSIIKLLLW